ncbi:MAG: hypothetical protein IJB91_00685 [Oscillospiraceae bacterium]|nr:hypothetical protein [Oscillospiraceae bacterium]
MTDKIKHIAVMLTFLVLTGVISFFCLTQESTAVSDSERRPLAQMPEYSSDKLLSGNFFPAFESYTVDQFPLRDSFRNLKAFIHTNLLGRNDNNGYYEADGYLGKLDYPLNESSLSHVIDRMQFIRNKYFKDGNHKVFYSVIPDKNYFLADKRPVMDYEKLIQTMEANLNDMTYIDIFDTLTIEDYYKTDTHWRQEQLSDVVQTLGNAMGIGDQLSKNYTVKELYPFYGVYSGQSALPTKPESLYYLTNSVLENCTVYNTETGKTGSVYDLDRFESQDPYEIFLSGSQAILTIQNPANTSGKRLILFRDSFGSSLAPLLAEAYSEVVLVDIRYVSSAFLDRFIEFTGQEDVLFLYSTLVLNSSSTLK